MIAFMNYAVPILLVISIAITLRLKSYKPLLVGAALAVVYTVAQPNYLPKGRVPAPVIQEIEYIDKPIVDRGRHPMSDAQRDKQREDKLREINDSIESKIKEGN